MTWPFQFALMVNKWRCAVCSFKVYHHCFAYLLSTLNNRRDVFAICVHSMFSFMYSDLLKEFIASEWRWNQWTLHLHCITLRVVTPSGVSDCSCITTVDPETRLCKRGAFFCEPKLHPKAKLAERWDTNKIIESESKGRRREDEYVDAGYICPHFIDRNDLVSIDDSPLLKSMILIWLVKWLGGKKEKHISLPAWLDWMSPSEELPPQSDVFSSDLTDTM